MSLNKSISYQSISITGNLMFKIFFRHLYITSNHMSRPYVSEYKGYLQGVPFEKWIFQMTVALKRCIFDPMLVKPKCVWKVAVFLKNCKQTAEKCKQIFENWKKLPPLKHILALPTWGQICTVSVLQPFEISIFQMKHPVTFDKFY